MGQQKQEPLTMRGKHQNIQAGVTDLKEANTFLKLQVAENLLDDCVDLIGDLVKELELHRKRLKMIPVQCKERR